MFRLGWQLGFRAASYTGETAISEGICNISGPRYIYLGINDYQNSANNYFSAAFSESILSPNIIGRIPIVSEASSERIYRITDINPTNHVREYFGPVDIQRLSLSLYDEYGRIIDLNYMDWSLVLDFECLYD